MLLQHLCRPPSLSPGLSISQSGVISGIPGVLQPTGFGRFARIGQGVSTEYVVDWSQARVCRAWFEAVMHGLELRLELPDVCLH